MRVMSLSVADASARLAELKHDLNVALNWKERLDHVLADLLKRLHDDLPKRGRSIHQQRLAQELAAAVTDVKVGCPVMDGVSVHIDIENFAGKPGLDEVTEEIPKLRKDIKALRRHLTRWPTETTVHPYRFKGSMGLSLFDGRELEPGEVVNLTRAQAAGWRDRFDEVEDTAAQKAS